MKNTLLFFFIFTLLSAGTYAQKNKKVSGSRVTVPENVNTSFKSQFTETRNNQWDKNYSGNYVASFINADSLKQSAEFDGSGSMIKTKITYQLNHLPQNVTDALARNYADTKIMECTKLQLPGIPPYYKVKVATPENTQKEILISEEGTVSE